MIETNNKYVILVDENDSEIGIMEKLEAHQKGLLHRAFSIFILNSKNEILLQKRANTKYHSPGLWSNTCCSHPQPNQSLISSAQLRLKDEMGMIAEIKPMFSFIYKVPFDNGLWEHEYDHVFIGISDDKPIINSNEVEDYKYVSIEWLNTDIEKNPENYTSWLKICFNKFISAYELVN